MTAGQFVYVIGAYTIALAMAGVALTAFGQAGNWLADVSGLRMAAFAAAFALTFGALHWRGPPRLWRTCAAWAGLYVLFLVLCVATSAETASWLMIFTMYGVTIALAVGAAALGAAYWLVVSYPVSGSGERLGFSHLLGGNPLGAIWRVAMVWLLVALGLEAIAGQPERLFDFLRGLSGLVSLDFVMYGGEQTVFRLLLAGLMGLIGVAVARRATLEAPWGLVAGFALGGALIAQVWDVPIYHPDAFWRVFGEFAGPYRLVHGAIAGGACGMIWFAAAQLKQQWQGGRART